MTKVIVGRPPNFEAIKEVFPLAERATTIFAYDPHIYVSSPIVILPPALMKHENVHIRRQKEMGVEILWRKYLNDKDFRYEEELLAHIAEYKEMVAKETTRQARRRYLYTVGKRLAAPLYKFNITIDKAMKDIQSGAKIAE